MNYGWFVIDLYVNKDKKTKGTQDKNQINNTILGL